MATSMRAVVVYESMYGNTRKVAEAIGSGLAATYEVLVTPVSRITSEVLATADLLLVGGPTHAWGMSRPSTRQSALAAAGRSAAGLAMEPDATCIGLREWLASLGTLRAGAAAFDTRRKIPIILSGCASRSIARKLQQHGGELAAPRRSFFVDKSNHLLPQEEAAARGWGEQLATTNQRSP